MQRQCMSMRQPDLPMEMSSVSGQRSESVHRRTDVQSQDVRSAQKKMVNTDDKQEIREEGLIQEDDTRTPGKRVIIF